MSQDTSGAPLFNTTTTFEFHRIKGAPVRCTDLECNIPASYAVVAPTTRAGDSCRLYEMQPFCVYHYLKLRDQQEEAKGK